jgi:UDP-N-acetylmuramoylalanine--D-glutamate ligase
MKDNLKDLKNKRITIMGLGLNQGGLGVTQFLVKAGAQILVTDLKTKEELNPSLEKLKGFNIKYVLGRHREEDFINTDMVIQNPAIPHNSKYLKIARSQGILIETDLGLFFQLCPSKKIIAIAGTKGKSTVSFLVYQIFKEAQKEVVLAGNIGISVLDILEKITPQTWVILEISTWQMEGMKKHKFRPQTAVLTNILPDHLDRY